ncbi:hypothetical protein E2C01_005175 [Portunus trituberculatus]|uniref:Uncharacterized protein n=1 Tax=Portunus trituberculatus TaxID=210409 RepID=A0A5B7CVX5_PORTR|nr:hypothetical protein [Portunus trituberculatus]
MVRVQRGGLAAHGRVAGLRDNLSALIPQTVRLSVVQHTRAECNETLFECLAASEWFGARAGSGPRSDKEHEVSTRRNNDGDTENNNDDDCARKTQWRGRYSGPNNHRVPLSLTSQWEQRLCAEQDVGVNTERGETTWGSIIGMKEDLAEWLGEPERHVGRLLPARDQTQSMLITAREADRLGTAVSAALLFHEASIVYVSVISTGKHYQSAAA